MENENGKTVVFVNMLGEFSITVRDNRIDDHGNQSKKPWSLLEYLIAFRKREISMDELIELLWGDEDSSNPGGALKTLLFRVRKLLAPLGCEATELIIHQRGCYAWNPQLDTRVDADEFEALCNRVLALDFPDADDQLELCFQALALYKGDFLPKSGWESWVIPISTFYHSLYQRLVHQTLSLLKERKDWQKIIDICQKAAAIEPFDETIHYNLIYSLYKSGNQQASIEHYNHTINMFYDEFAITPSDELKDLYKVIQDTKHGVTTDLSLVQDSLHKEADSDGAFYCEYTVFKDIYQVEMRAIGRTGDSIYIGLITISDENGDMLKTTVLPKAMETLGEAIRESLRRGDVYTRFSVSQYAILIPTATYENGEMILKRITSKFKKCFTRKNVSVNFALQALLPA